MISPPLFYRDELRCRLIITLSMLRVVQHVCEAVRQENTELERVKQRYLDEWTQAVNAHGAFGRWRWKVARHPVEIRDVL
ncbi:hypothetical protein NW844_10780 [Synechococcus sp. H55.2]|uniref:hypothetical protein n=2 Tax=Synechococcus TaxID=1129 RepID=UPI0039C1BC0C